MSDERPPPKNPPPVPSVLEIHPGLRRHTRRAAMEIRRLVEAVVIAFPDALILAREPRAAESMDTTPHDPVAADLIASARRLSDAISALDDPP